MDRGFDNRWCTSCKDGGSCWSDTLEDRHQGASERSRIFGQSFQDFGQASHKDAATVPVLHFEWLFVSAETQLCSLPVRRVKVSHFTNFKELGGKELPVHLYGDTNAVPSRSVPTLTLSLQRYSIFFLYFFAERTRYPEKDNITKCRH